MLERRCYRTIAFEDLCVARQHQVDIRLLERTVTMLADVALCITTRWAEAMELRRGR